jgi:hypothetical protein
MSARLFNRRARAPGGSTVSRPWLLLRAFAALCQVRRPAIAGPDGGKSPLGHRS